jgi:heme exporter protein D
MMDTAQFAFLFWSAVILAVVSIVVGWLVSTKR